MAPRDEERVSDPEPVHNRMLPDIRDGVLYSWKPR